MVSKFSHAATIVFQATLLVAFFIALTLLVATIFEWIYGYFGV
jgi:hypothetical protein